MTFYARMKWLQNEVQTLVSIHDPIPEYEDRVPTNPYIPIRILEHILTPVEQDILHSLRRGERPDSSKSYRRRSVSSLREKIEKYAGRSALEHIEYLMRQAKYPFRKVRKTTHLPNFVIWVSRKFLMKSHIKEGSMMWDEKYCKRPGRMRKQ